MGQKIRTIFQKMYELLTTESISLLPWTVISFMIQHFVLVNWDTMKMSFLSYIPKSVFPKDRSADQLFFNGSVEKKFGLKTSNILVAALC